MQIRLLIIALFLSVGGWAQTTQYLLLDWQWSQGKLLLEGQEDLSVKFHLSLDGSGEAEVEFLNPIFIPCSKAETAYLQQHNIDSELLLEIAQGIERKKIKINGSFVPLRVKNGQMEKLIYAELRAIATPQLRKMNGYADHSILNSGNWHKIAVYTDGIHQITYQDLQGLGLDAATVNPQNLRLYGRSGGMLSYLNSVSREDDLQELSIEVIGGDDGFFDEGDYILFYGESPHQWSFGADGRFRHQTHYYSDNTYYFITTDLGAGKRISAVSTLSSANNTITSFDDYIFHESEETNFIKSGRRWYGDKFGVTNSRNFSFSFPNITGEVYLKSGFASNAASPYSSSFSVNATGMSSQVVNIGGVSGSYTYANLGSLENTFNATSSSIQVDVNFSSSSSSGEGWIDYIELNARRQLAMSGSQMIFRDISSVGVGEISEFKISNANSSLKVWEVTDPLSVQLVPGALSSSEYSFILNTDSLREFIAFTGGYRSVTLGGAVSNQDLHGLDEVDMLIVAHPSFWSEAERLADFHRGYDGFTVAIVSPQQIYNEFSAGAQDVSAIRDFIKMLYDRQEEPLQYVLLFGDASYDPKNRISDNTNFIVAYQSDNSHSETNSYITDDFFALLDEEESITSNTPNLPFLDVGIGRFPVKTAEEAKIAVDKVLHYVEEESFGDWRINMCFVGDDNDVTETVHTSQAEQLADYVSATYPQINIDKVYIDAYEQESTPGGQRCPDANRAITEQIEKGVFVMNYTGHGGEVGWAHERILGLDDINSWSNSDKLPLFMTATCEFSRYDDPERTSAGEYVFLKENGGAIALFTTSRVVFTGSNLDLNESFVEQLYEKNEDGTHPRIGDILRRTKNNVTNVSSTNHRNFTLLGDPALCLAYPKYDIVLTTVQDSLQALGKVTISGEVVDDEGELKSDFNGFVYPSVFDKKSTFQTLGQDESPVLEIDLQKSLLFKGKSTVSNGQFTFSFVVPKDINYSYGAGKVSLYAEGNTDVEVFTDAAGYNLDIVIGGTADDYEDDIDGPEVELFMNDTNFVYGGLTDESPSLLAVLFDDNGINTVGNGIGHDMVAVLDEASNNPIVLNDFYESDADSYQSGKVLYPFAMLSEGNHTLRVKVWDVFNNSSEGYTEFLVSESENLSVQNLLNYPNPMVDYTEFYFEHNQAGEVLEVTLEIVSSMGQVVKVIQENVTPNGYRYGPISWNGDGQQGSRLASGFYVYRLLAKAADGEILENSGRLVITK